MRALVVSSSRGSLARSAGRCRGSHSVPPAGLSSHRGIVQNRPQHLASHGFLIHTKDMQSTLTLDPTTDPINNRPNLPPRKGKLVFTVKQSGRTVDVRPLLDDDERTVVFA